MTRAEALRQYWADVRAGRREPPKRKSDGTVTRTLSIALDGIFGPESERLADYLREKIDDSIMSTDLVFEVVDVALAAAKH